MQGAIYGLADTRTNEIRYVGKTVQKVDVRVRFHLQAYGPTHRACWIKSIGRENVATVVLERDPPGDLNEAERIWIATLRDLGCRLTNHTDGGDGSYGWRPTPEVLARRNAAIRAAHQRPEVKAKLSAAHKELGTDSDLRARRSVTSKRLWSTPEYREKIAATRKANPYSPSAATRAKIGRANSKPLVHGTYSAYSNRRCRCLACKSCASAYNKAYRARLAAERQVNDVWSQAS